MCANSNSIARSVDDAVGFLGINGNSFIDQLIAKVKSSTVKNKTLYSLVSVVRLSFLLQDEEAC